MERALNNADCHMRLLSEEEITLDVIRDVLKNVCHQVVEEDGSLWVSDESVSVGRKDGDSIVTFSFFIAFPVHVDESTVRNITLHCNDRYMFCKTIARDGYLEIYYQLDVAGGIFAHNIIHSIRRTSKVATGIVERLDALDLLNIGES
jgi:hypothetical protein